jgi:hypothetical protein
MRHQWKWKDLTGTGACTRCRVKTTRKRRPSMKPRFKGEKVSVQVYRLPDGTVTEKMPACSGGE